MILIRRGQYLWTVKILLVPGNVILMGNWVVSLQNRTVHLFTLLNVHRVVNSWVGFPHKIQEHRSPTNNDDSTVFILLR